MSVRKFGPLSVGVPSVGQGTWQMEEDGRSAAIAAIRRGVELGLTHIDTAELYGHGQVEKMVAEAIAGLRDKVFLASKVMPSHGSFDAAVSACEASLRRLGTDYLDLYMLHWPGSYPLEATLGAFEQLQRQGKIRAYGVSNFDVDDLEAAIAIVGEGKLVCNQVLYHLEERAIEHGVLPWCERHGVAVVGYSPYGSGHFPSPQSQGGKALEQVAKGKGVTARQVALAFLTRRPSLFTIPKASSVAHVEENAAAQELVLSEEELALLDKSFPKGDQGRGLPVI